MIKVLKLFLFAIVFSTTGLAYAATVAVSSVLNISEELAPSSPPIALPSITITLGDEYAVNDRLILTINGATVSSLAGVTLVDSSGEISFGKVAESSDNTVSFRITAVAGDGSGSTMPTTGNVLTLSGVLLSTSSVVDGGDVTVTYTGSIPPFGMQFDTAGSALAINVYSLLEIGSGSTISLEGAASETSITLPSVTITLGDEYAVNDRLVLTINGATLASQTGATLVDGSGELQFGKLASSSDNTVTFRITSLADDGAGSTVPTTGNTLTLSGITLTTASVVDGGNVTVTYSGSLSDGTVIESAGPRTAIAVTAQFGGSITNTLDGIIDVNADRQEFTTGTSDTLTITPTEVTGLSLAATATILTNTLWGDFSFVDADGDGVADISFSVAGTDDTFTAVTIADDFMSATYGQGVIGAIDATTLNVVAPGQADDNPTLDKQSFTVTSALAYTDNQGTAGSKNLINGGSAGAWTLNGAQVFVPYMPIGFPGVQSVMVLANDGSQDGEVELEAFDSNGNTYGPMVMGTLAGGTNMTIYSYAVSSTLGLSSSAKLSVTVTVNAPADDVTATGYIQKAGTGRMLMSVVDE